MTYKIVVWQSAFLGDLVLTSNLLLNIRELFPKAEILLVARPFAKELFMGWDWLKVEPLEKTLSGTLRVVRRIIGFKLGFGVQRGARTSFALWAARVKLRVGFDRAELSFFYHLKAPHRWGIHEVDRNLNLLRALGLKPKRFDLKLPTDGEFLSRTLEKFSVKGEYAVISPSANFKPKRWAEEHFAEVAKFLLKRGLKVVLTGGAADGEVAERVKKLANSEGVLNLAGKTSVGELVHLIKGARLVVANDSAPIHIAEAVGTPSVAVYCATSSKYGFFPRSGIFLEPKGLKCHPCKPNPKVCKTGTEECRRAVKPEEVLRAISNLLGF